MKVLYSSDLHGRIHLYEALLELAISSSSEIIALGGDLLPSLPSTKRYGDMPSNQKDFIFSFLLPFFNRVIEATSVDLIFLIPGNWDLGYPDLFRKPNERIIDLDRKCYRLRNGYELVGYPFVPPTPFRPKTYEKMDDREAPWPPQKNPSYIRASDETGQLVPVDPQFYLRQQDTIQEDLKRLPTPSDSRTAVYMMHSPPLGTRLDLIQGGRSAGSRSIRVFIEEDQPFLTLHGHIHESPEISGSFLDYIGETLSVNPGQVSLSGKESSRLYAVTFEMERAAETLAHTSFSRGDYPGSSRAHK